jgi:hypothetical protein
MIVLLKTNNLSLNHEYLKFDAIFIKIGQLRIDLVIIFLKKILLYIYILDSDQRPNSNRRPTLSL